MTGKMLLKIAWGSLWYRRGAAFIAIIAIAVSVFSLLSAEHLRQTAKRSFSSTVSGVDLIVGPRTGDMNLLLTTVFRIGVPSQNMSWQSYQSLSAHKSIDWVIPISLGDSHKGFRVVGTEIQFFSHFQYGQSRDLEFIEGEAFSGLHDVVLGSRVAQSLGYDVGRKLILAHGLANTSFQTHDAHPFGVSGVLKATGTPIDNALYVSLAGLKAVHQSSEVYPEALDPSYYIPTSISATMVGLKTKLATFKVQRELNTSIEEPLTAILPGVTLTQLWQMSRGVENSLVIMTQLILFSSLLGLGAMMIASLRERSYEFSVFRVLGAGSTIVFVLIQMESLLVAIFGIALGALAFLLGLTLAKGIVAASYGIDIDISRISFEHGFVILYVISGALAVGAVPALIGCFRARIA